MTMQSLQTILETEGSVNAVAGMATPDVPLFSTRRFGGWDDHVIPEDHYMSLRKGRDRMARWNTHLPNETIQSAVRKSLYRDGCCLITNATSGLSVMLKHDIQRRQQKAQDLDATMSESTESLIEADGDFTFFDEASVAPLILEAGEDYDFDEEDEPEYIDAFNFALDELKITEDEADAFAQIVACFADNVNSSDADSDTIDSMFNAAVTEVQAGTLAMGLVEIDITTIHAAKKYIEANYDVVTGEMSADGQEIEYDLGEDDGAMVLEAAALAALPSVNPEDPSKSAEEGWAIIKLEDNEVVDPPKQGETMEHKTSWMSDYYGQSGAQGGMEVAWVNTKTGVVTKVSAEPAKKPSK